MTAKLNQLGRNVDAIVDNSLHKSAYQIQRKAVSNIQSMSVSYNGNVYDAKDTGRLVNSISVEKLDNCQYAVGTGVEYAPYVEFGTGSAGDPSVAHTACPRWVYCDNEGNFHTAYPQPARPFLRPAFEQHKKIVSQNIINAIVNAWQKGGMK